METKSKTEKIYCNQCGLETKHSILFTHTQLHVDKDYDLSLRIYYEMLECCGCEEIVVRRCDYFSEWEPGEHETSYYPPRVARRLPAWKNKLNKEIVNLLEEVYAALQADSRSLAMMGARALIDMVILHEVGDVGSFPEKLDALEKAGFISAKNRIVLEAALNVGNAASHRGHRPEPEHVEAVMDIVENLLHTTVLESVVPELEKSTPKRKSS